MKKLIAVMMFVLVISTQAQDEVKAEPFVPHWEHSMITGLNISQISFSNWAKGGENSLSWVVTLDLTNDYLAEDWSFKNQFRIAYGRTKLGTAQYKTNDNELFNESVIARNIGWAVDPFFSNTLRTTIAKGFDYEKVPALQIADIFDPTYLTQSLGFTYDRMKNFNTRFGVAIQEVFTTDYPQFTDDPETLNEIETTKIETGVESVTDFTSNFAENMQYKTKLRLFSAFDRLDTWDVRWDNVIQAKVNTFVNVNLNVIVLYEKVQTPFTQVKQALQLGFTYTLF
ncbi:MAG: DUF3078 domain-containing protein [Melioribacteraceae bacterium]|nr:DUF3078 domain-containing protein [Melioribacteraceae bacterium]MCF8262997.1 DUF3078 domain-containing protein [Melioribacteraceae bacterium]MCF8413991.1 DUF3078 domain-containing protein [Melioribacteraceae bacterium]MCF8430442.1 DUF3078 domain-containing protein [Melioribacteraceae bacterium]